MTQSIHSFLGANTPLGFISLFGELYDPFADNRLYIIKGGPGTGKSNLMKKLAKASIEKGFDTELVHCSSDPGSLDAVIIPGLSLSVADGTSPHLLEPRFPGAVESIINTGDFWNEKQLAKNSDGIRSLTLENSIYHRRSSRFLSAAGQLIEDTQRLVEESINEEKLNGFAIRFCSREAPNKKSRPGKRSERFLSGITPLGIVMFDETVTALASKIIAIEDEYSVASGMLVERIGENALKNGYDVIFCRCPMKPKSWCEHVIIPEADIAVVSARSTHHFSFEPYRSIHVRRFTDMEKVAKRKQRIAFNKRVCNELISESVKMLEKAKQTHDRLEAFYIESMDFGSFGRFEEEFVERVVS